ncbi:MAG: alternative ribosome rescue aminoacyl-tRNA hydrolase ArfB [Deltaproteobacteria bacterium]|jgi:ribosome-associated protein
MDDLSVSPTVTIPARELRWSASRSGGPGGQNVNKVSSKVDLRFDLEASEALTDAQKSRLRAAARNRLDEDGAIQIVVQDTRDQQKNLELARARLAELIRKSMVVPKARKKTRPSLGAKRRRLNDKKRVGDKKRDRRPIDE